MSETGKLIDQRQDQTQQNLPGQDAALWEGVRQFACLPDWLKVIRDSGLVGRTLAGLVPEFREGGWELIECEAGHIRYKSDFWTALVQLTARQPGTGENIILPLQARIFPPGNLTGPSSVEGRLGEQGWLALMPELNLELRAREPETVLAALESLTDPEASRQFLEDSIRADTPAYHDLRIQTCAPKVVRYKPGSRCTVVYRLGYDPQEPRAKDWPNLVVAKTYRAEKGKNAFDSMAALWNSPLGKGDLVRIAEPLAYRQEIKVLVQGPIREEHTLKDLLYSAFQSSSREVMDEANRFMRKTAAGLAALHNTGVHMGRDWDWQDEMNEVHHQLDRLVVALPELNSAAQPLLTRLDRLAAEIPPDPHIPAHGSFRPAQVLIYKGEIGFIDFDSFCQSEPANDLALFLGTLFSIGLTPTDDDDAPVRQPLDPATRQERFDRLMEMHNEFLEEYGRSHPVTYRRVVLWEALDIFMFVLHGWTKIKVGEIDDIVYLLERFLEKSGVME